MKLNPDTLSILKAWKEDETISHGSNDFIQIEEKDWETVEYFATKKYATKGSKEWFSRMNDLRASDYRYRDSGKQTWKDYYQNNYFLLVDQLEDKCSHGRKYSYGGGIRQEIKQAVRKAFNYQFFEDFRCYVFMPFIEKHRAWFHLEHKAKPNYEEKTQTLNEWKFSTAEQFFKREKKEEVN